MNFYNLQKEFEDAEYLFNLPADESKPYEHKYAAREKLNKILLNVGEVQDKDTRFVIQMLVNFHLATNYLETEENFQAEKHFQETIKILSHLPPKSMQYYLNYLQECYNALGILLTNREDVSNGLSAFAKAEQLKTVADQIYAVTKTCDVFSSIEYSRLLSDPNNKEKIRFTSYLEGGLNILRFEKNFTLTIFYMAQAYTKANLKYKAAEYCGDTLKRQFERNEYELKDWCVNCMSLTDYFIEHRQFAQAQYILAAGMSVIPEGKKKKLRASFHMALGRYLLEFLKFAVEKYRLGQSEEPILKTEINKKTLEFNGVGVKFVELNVPKNYEEMASVFRQLNTQAKKALQVYVLDGYVTENIQICRDLSLAYKMLTIIETDPEKILALHERRRELLETPASEINPKAYENFYQVFIIILMKIRLIFVTLPFSIFHWSLETSITVSSKLSGRSRTKRTLEKD